MNEEFVVRDAVRQATPQIIAIAGPSSSGKTFTALLVAAGLAGPDGVVGMVDTENGRGTMYADDPFIVKAFPRGYKIVDLRAPFTPKRYIAALNAMESAGCTVCVIDSGSHEWEGEGGCTDIAEKDKGRWNNAKREHKRFVQRLLNSGMHVIVCLRAREKSKIIPASESPTKKEIVESLGIQAICEKNFMYEMLISFLIEDNKTHQAIPVKIPGPLRHLFIAPDEYKQILAKHGVASLPEASGRKLELLLVDLQEAMKPRLLSVSDGEAIARWNNGGAAFDDTERLQHRQQDAAEHGMAEYQAFWKSITPTQRKTLQPRHEHFKAVAAEADAQAVQSDVQEIASLRELLGDKPFFDVLGKHGVEKFEDANADERAKILDELKGMVG